VNIAGGSQHIWDSTAFWPVAGIIATLLAGAAAVWAALSAADSKRRLYCTMPEVTPLLTRRPDLPDIEVRSAGKVLANPQVVTVRLVSRGRSDIKSGLFHGGEPLCLDVGAAIEGAYVTTWPGSYDNPVCKLGCR
jgi:hypothetical protein